LRETAIIFPSRVSWSEKESDVFALLQQGAADGVSSTLVSIVSIEGGSPRGVGSHMAVLGDGRYIGYVSGGCVEAAVAAEAMRLMVIKSDDVIIKFGAGSRYLDIKLPCGGAINLHFGLFPSADVIESILSKMWAREAFAVTLGPLAIALPNLSAPQLRHYVPATKLMLLGNGIELLTMAKTARANGYDVEAFSPDIGLLEQIAQAGAQTHHLKSFNSPIGFEADRWTAIVSLFHDFDWEMALLPKALETEAFYIGALGSPNTHRRRLEGLAKLGISDDLTKRIIGPIGIIPATRNASALALSVLAEITARRPALNRDI
jgi:xanthine dehydrogenase accessory factor